ncbi:MAG: DUF4271 domain-containing protein [Crocinitomicaceae bacterium]|nr:DUF4271 domain-containing protein [Crocinitomicaceae bacterium]
MILNVSSISLSRIPEMLQERFISADVVVGVLIVLCFVAVSIASMMKDGIYTHLFVVNAKFQGINSYLRENFPLKKSSSMLLLLNYVTATTVIVYLFLKSMNLSVDGSSVSIMLIPLIWLVWNLLGMILTGWLTGEGRVFREVISLRIVGAQSLGFILFFCALIWSLNGKADQVQIQLVFWVVIIEYTFRSIKSILVVFNERVRFYYIILYFCTLEILPIIVGYYLLKGYFV